MGKRHLILIGPSGTGKSSVAAELGRRLGWDWRDTDEMVEQQVGRSVASIFRDLGEPAFRLLESGAIARACQSEQPTVIAVGGGAVLDATNRALISEHGRVIYLVSKPQDILERLRRETNPNGLPSRPLLAGSDPLKRIVEQIGARQPIYNQLSEIEISTAELDVASVTDRVIDYLNVQPAHNISIKDWRTVLSCGDTPNNEARQNLTAQLMMRQNVSDDELNAIAEELVGGDVGLRVIADAGIWSQVEQLVSVSGRRYFMLMPWNSNPAALPMKQINIKLPPCNIQTFQLPSGEAAKSSEQLEAIYNWLAETKTERGDIIVAIGGGATGDVAGYAAATYLRGLRVVQVPTTLLAMVDSAIGGKTAINLAAGKNLVGAFHQPWQIIIDPNWLRTMPQRDYTSGWGEICKYAMIEASISSRDGLLGVLEQNAAMLYEVPSEDDVLLSDYRQNEGADKRLLAKVISCCAGMKAQVVAADEREREGGLRVLLNYGHTLGHALERATRYDGRQLLHGEGVAIGMTAVAMIGERLGVCDASLLARQTALLQAYSLPTNWAHLDVSLAEVLAATQLDKKARGQKVRWVLPTAPGRVQLRDDVPPELAAEVIAELRASD